MKLTTGNIDLPRGKDDVIHFDSQLTGFGLRLRRASGGKTIRNWIIAYRVSGHQRRMIVGSAEVLTAAQARELARKLLARVALGEDPQHDRAERRERDAHSLRSVTQDFLDSKAGTVKPRTHEQLTSYLLGPHLRPLLAMPVDRVERRDIAARLLAASKNSGVPTTVGLRSAISSMFSWAMQMGLVEANPVVNAFKPKTPEARDRVLSTAELRAIWLGLEDDDYGRVIKLLVLTAARRGEVGEMRWSEFAPDMTTWTLPKERSKNGLAHTLPLTPLMLSIIESVPRRDGFDILWGYRHGFTGWSIGKRALDAKLGLPHWTHHDLRRSAATHMADLSIAPHVIEQVLNHRSGHRRGVAAIYNRSVYEREVRDAMLMWSDRIQALIENRKRKLTSLDEHRRSS